MMKPLDQYKELLTLTKQYLLQEHQLTDRIFDEQETFAYFKKLNLKNNPPQIPLAPVQKIVLPLEKKTFTPPIVQKEIKQEKLEPVKIASLVQSKEVQPIEPSIPLKENIKKTEPKTIFKIEPLQQLNEINLSDLKKIITEQFSHIPLIQQIPDDTEAKKLSTLWSKEEKKADVLILTFNEPQAHLELLHNMGKAIEKLGYSIKFCPALKVEREKEWGNILKAPHFKLIISESSGLHLLQDLKKHHREEQKLARHYLNQSPLILLSDISFYLKEPSFKISLWQAIKELLSLSKRS